MHVALDLETQWDASIHCRRIGVFQYLGAEHGSAGMGGALTTLRRRERAHRMACTIRHAAGAAYVAGEM